jgi:hypothetical protein
MCKLHELTIEALEAMPIGTTFEITSKAWRHSATLTKVDIDDYECEGDRGINKMSFHPSSNFERIDYHEITHLTNP